ncbi:MAG: tetratricopeptide repeat protein [Candidatus Omnitrophica bacterium]|nr:tetratricopeptide repeat protein [Candidatus Omnitrophota bacterium]
MRLSQNQIVSFILVPFTLFVFGVVVYFNSLSASFHADDAFHIISNPLTRHADEPLLIWNSIAQRTYFVTYYTFALNYAVHQLDVAGYHWVNLWLHIGTAAAVFWLTRITVSLSRQCDLWKASEKFWMSFLTALIFLLHPVQTEAVNYISQRSVCLGALLYILTVCLYMQGRLGGRFSILCFAGSILCLLLGMLTHPMVFTLPLMIFLIEGVFFKNFMIKEGTGTVLGYALVMLLLTVLFALSLSGGVNALSPVMSQSHEGDQITWMSYLLTQVKVVGTYLKIFVWPFGQNFDYDVPMAISILNIRMGITLLLGAVIIFMLLKQIQSKDFLFVAVSWFFLGLWGGSGMHPQEIVMAEHRLYLSVIGLAMLLTVMLFQHIVNKRLRMVVIIALLTGLSFLTVQRNRVWVDDFRLWSDVVKKSPNKSRGYVNLAAAFMDRNDHQRAVEYLYKALEINPQNLDAYTRLGLISLAQENFDQAKANFEKAIAIDNTRAFPFNNLGVVYLLQEEYHKAEEAFNQALVNKPSLLEPRLNLIRIYKARKEYDKALNQYKRLAILYPDNRQVLSGLAELYSLIGEDDKAAQVTELLEKR